MVLAHFTLLGERCSGTNFLEYLIQNNYDLQVDWSWGWKHFFRPSFWDIDLSTTLVLAIVRNPHDWLASLFRYRHHVPGRLGRNWNRFLQDEWYSLNDSGKEIMEDRHLWQERRYASLLELRAEKLKFLLATGHHVPFFALVRLEDLQADPVGLLKKLERQFGLPRSQRSQRRFRLIKKHLKKPEPYQRHIYKIPAGVQQFIDQNLNWSVEREVGYFLSSDRNWKTRSRLVRFRKKKDKA